ncbi:glycosyltransferase family 4 protein [Vibrio gallaecicus]|uniref:Glycosyltransferase family 4 protein n=1 Tax=Vibrio gallaecicus TaxID=552386 RepID=A0ABV4NAJ6_9VIBR
MKKILILAPLSSGHVQKWLQPIANEYEFIFFTLHDAKLPDSFSNCRVYRFPRVTGTRLDFILSIPYLQMLILKIEPDLLYASFLSSYGILGSLVYTKVKRLLSVWGTDVNGKASSNLLFKYVISKLISRYCWINAPAEHIKNKLVNLGAEINTIDVFQYGIDTTSYVIKDSYDVSKRIRFLSIRNWDELYNIDYVIYEYFTFCNKNGIESELNIIGRGEDDRFGQLQALINSLDFKLGKVNILGYLNKEELSKVYLNNDVIISVPSMDGTPLSVLESIYIGLIPIVSDIDANREWFDNKTAFFCSPNKVNSLSNALEKCADFMLDDLMLDVVENNRTKVLEKSDYFKNTRLLSNKIKSCLTNVDVN